MKIIVWKNALKTIMKIINFGNENCLTCDVDTEFKYLINATGFGNNCVSSCPSGTELNGNGICILSNPKNKEDDGGNNALVISLSIVGGLLIIALAVYIFICFRKRKKNQFDLINNKKCDDTLINEINKDLHLYQSFV